MIRTPDRRKLKRAWRADPEKALEILEDTRESWARDFHRGLALWRAGKTEEALEALRSADGAESPAPALYRGLVCADAGIPGEAREAAERARELSPHNPLVTALEVILRFEEGNLDRALAELEQELGESSIFLGRILTRVEKKIMELKGRFFFVGEPAELTVPQKWGVRRLCRRGYYLLERQDVRGAMELFKRAWELQPDNEKVRRGYGITLIFFEPERAVELFGESEQTGVYLPMAMCASGRFENALQRVQSELEEGWSVELGYVSGLCYIGLGRMREAGDELARVIDDEPELLPSRAELLKGVLEGMF